MPKTPDRFSAKVGEELNEQQVQQILQSATVLNEADRPAIRIPAGIFDRTIRYDPCTGLYTVVIEDRHISNVPLAVDEATYGFNDPLAVDAAMRGFGYALFPPKTYPPTPEEIEALHRKFPNDPRLPEKS